MKKGIYTSTVVLLGVFMVAFFGFPAKALAAEQATWAKPAVVALNKANVKLVEEIRILLKRNNLASIEVYDEVDKETVVVSKNYSPLISRQLFKELNNPSCEEERCVELAMDMADYNRVLRTALIKLKAMSGEK